MKKLLMAILMGLFALGALPVNAALDLELTQGIQRAMPIAVIPFAGQDNLQDPNNIAAVVSSDLGDSGRFKVANISALQQFPHSNQNIDFLYWQKQGQNDLVVGKVTALPNDRYQVDFQLINVFAGSTGQANVNYQTPVLLSEQFTVNKTELRGVAHHISDLVYQKLTGDRGIFATKIAYVLVQGEGPKARYSLEVSDIDGYGPKPLLISNEPIMSPAWSPSGKSIAYVSFEGGNPKIYIQNVATGKRSLVSDQPGLNNAPAWSPDGHKLALVLTKTGNPKIYIMNLDSGQLTQITHGYSIDTEPNWSPDGKSLIFTSDRGGGPEIYQINFASNQIQRLTFNSAYNARASFTPGGNHIVMITRDDSGYNIAAQDLQNGRVTLLTQSGMAQSPTVAPNGKMVAFAEIYDGSKILGMASVDGDVKLRLPAQEGNVQDPAWSPFLN